MCTTHFSSPSPPPSSDPISSQHQHTEWLKPLRIHASRTEINDPSPFPRADALCSPRTTAPVVLDRRAAADRVPPRSPGPFTPDALDLRAAGNQIDLDGAATPTVSTPPSSPYSTPKTNNKLHYLIPSMAVLLQLTSSSIFRLRRVGGDHNHHGSPHMGMTGRWRCAVLTPRSSSASRRQCRSKDVCVALPPKALPSLVPT